MAKIPARLRALAAEHGYRLLPGSDDTHFDVADAGGMIAPDVTESELRQLISGIKTFAQLRPSAPATIVAPDKPVERRSRVGRRGDDPPWIGRRG